MKKIIILNSIFLLLFACQTKKTNNTGELGTNDKQIEVGIHKSIETFMILRALSNEDPLFKYRNENYKGKPIMYEARKHFSAYKNHITVKETQKSLNATSITGDIILQGLLYFSELPNASLKYEIDSKDWSSRKDSLTSYLALLDKFYKEANVKDFIGSHDKFYDGAIDEAKSYLDNQLIPTMEEYFGQKNLAYKMILIPNSPFGMGFGASVSSDNVDIFYQIISPANDIEWKESSSYTEYGYSGEGAKEYYRDLVVHEFCHPFITPFIKTEKWKKEISKTDSLFILQLDSIMSKQGYDTWWGFVNEHLVRLGEIRIAKEMGIKDLDNMRKYNIQESGFILLPEAEELVVQYENDRKKYKNFHDFIPELISQLSNYNRNQIKEKIQQTISDK